MKETDEMAQLIIDLRCRLEWYKGFLQGVAEGLETDYPELSKRMKEVADTHYELKQKEPEE